MAIDPRTHVTISLTVHHVQLVVDALNELPRKLVDELIHNIGNQANEQIKRIQEEQKLAAANAAAKAAEPQPEQITPPTPEGE